MRDDQGVGGGDDMIGSDATSFEIAAIDGVVDLADRHLDEKDGAHRLAVDRVRAARGLLADQRRAAELLQRIAEPFGRRKAGR